MMSLQSKIQSSIHFDNENIPNDFSNSIDLTNKNFKFGVLNLKISKIDPIIKKRHIIFTTDCSGSMSDICNDRRSKMEHSNHTLINMIIYFATHPELLVSISVFAFDCSLYTIIENEVVTKENLDKLIQNVKNIRPKDTTDIEKALKNSSDYISKFVSINNDDTDILHVFMTDGDATQGNSLPSILKKLVSPLVSNIFIGFGIDHNACLLKELASDSKNSYYFVDALEKAGLVYGEILHAFIYKIIENTIVTVKNGLLYDWKKNTWVDKINTGDLISETNKTIHVLSETPVDCYCLIESMDYLTKEIVNFTSEKTLCVDENNVVNGFVDLTKYKYRQRTQELLFDVNVHNFKNIQCYDPIKYNLYGDKYEDFCSKQKVNGVILKKKMSNLLKEMQELLENVRTKEDIMYQFIKMLCDDIYVCLQTFETKHSAMYSCARQVSQGAQRSYSANYNRNHNLDNSSNSNGLSAPKLMRSRAYNISTQEEIEEEFDDEFKLDSFVNININTGFNENEESVFRPLFPNIEEDNSFVLTVKKPSTDKMNNSAINVGDIDYDYSSEDDFDKYTVSEQTDNPYINDSIFEMMRTCSASLDDNKLFR